MVQNFKDKDTRRFFEGARIARFHAFAAQAIRRLTYWMAPRRFVTWRY